MIGAATPSGVTKYIKGIEDDGFGGDGLFQRFGLAIWPDITPDWRNVDNEPNREARDKAYDLFKKFDALVPSAVGAEYDLYEPTPFLRLDDGAETAFVAWREKLERRQLAQIGSGWTRTARGSAIYNFPHLTSLLQVKDRQGRVLRVPS